MTDKETNDAAVATAAAQAVAIARLEREGSIDARTMGIIDSAARHGTNGTRNRNMAK
jgi:hypothetical protein